MTGHVLVVREPRTELAKADMLAVIHDQRYLGRGWLVGPGVQPVCCAVGALLLAAGVPHADLKAVPSDLERWPQSLWDVLWNAYGITQAQAQRIVDANDGTEIGRRKQAVYDVIVQLELTAGVNSVG